jgi:ABC-type dipeptide/oligopeptide/nickel transport system permease subunit
LASTTGTVRGLPKRSIQVSITVFPGLLIFLSVAAFNLAGDLLRDALDPAQITRRGDA